jgi:DNA primase
MAGRIPQAFIDELIARADIVEVIGARVPLKKAGREFKACCPFHDEKSPSFWVSPHKQFYHCFGCGVHGTALGFLMDYEQLPFPEAVEELAGRLGLEVPHEGGNAPDRRAQEPLTELLARAAGFYEETLSGNDRARAYLRGRGLEAATIERFRIGYSPDAWNEVLRRFGQGEESRKALLATGLVIERETPRPGSDPCYDRFRDRIMFPIRDPRGRVLGFGGRVLEGGEPKYLNSPETELFHKGQELYGLHEMRLARTQSNRLLVVEGYMDVVRLHQAGITYAVATLGTATTPEHLKRAFRLVGEIVFCFDGDRAGRGAAWRALQNALPEAREGRELKFLFLPDGEDPDSLVGKEGKAAFEQRIAQAQPLSEYLVAQLRTEADLSHADGRASFLALARPLLAKVPAGIYQELLLARVASEVGLPTERLRALLTTGDGGIGADPRTTRAGTERPGQERGAQGRGGDGVGGRYTRGGARTPTAPGRRSLLTQAIQVLLHFPAAASALPPAACAAFDETAEDELPGVATLRELLAELRAHPSRSTAQLLEGWRERPEARRLSALYAEPVLLDSVAARSELEGTLLRLATQVRQERQATRHAELLARLGQGLATPEEKLEFQTLTSRLAATRAQPNFQAGQTISQTISQSVSPPTAPPAPERGSS